MPWLPYVTFLASRIPETTGKGDAPAWISALVALGTLSLAVLTVLLGKGWRVVTRTTHLLDDMLGEPARPGVPERPGVMQRLQSLTDDIARVQAQVIPNGGSSLRDAIDHLAADLKLVAEDLTEHRRVTGPAITQLTADVSELRGRVELWEHERADREDEHG